MASLRDYFSKIKGTPDDEYEDVYEPERPRDDYSSYSYHQDSRESRVVNFNARSQMQLNVFKPTSFGEDTRTIADELLNKHTVVLNLEETEADVRRRIVDFLSGVAYANNGKLKRISTSIVIITPFNVDMTGDDVMDELESSGIYF